MVPEIWHILLELAPWLLVGALIAGVLHAIVPSDSLRRHLTSRWGVVKAAAIGVPMPLCSCSVIPVGLGLRRQGASPGATVAFLISTPETGVDSILVSAGFFGWPFALFKWVSAFVIGLTGGVLTDRFAGDAANASETTTDCVEPESRGLRGILSYSVELLRSLWGWLAFGVVVSAAIGYFLPDNGLAAFHAYGGIVAMLIALVIGIPLYVCALASVPIAAALVNAGFPPGAALVFLIAGPATNIATMGAVYRILGRRTLGIYLGTIAVGSMACGLLFDGLVKNPTASTSGHEHHTAPAWWAVASAGFLLALVLKFAWDDAVRLWRSRARRQGFTASQNATAPIDRVEVPVQGMTCNNCVAKLERVIGREAGVSNVRVTLQPGRAVVHGEISEPRVRELVTQAGFHPG